MINEKEIEKQFDEILNLLTILSNTNSNSQTLSFEKLKQEKIKAFFDFLLEIKKELLSKKIELELNNDNSSDKYIEVNEYIKIITEIEGKYKNIFFNKIEYEEISNLTREVMLDKAFVKKIINIKV